MASLFRLGKKLVDKYEESQNRASAQQPYPSFGPTASLSSHFQQSEPAHSHHPSFHGSSQTLAPATVGPQQPQQYMNCHTQPYLSPFSDPPSHAPHPPPSPLLTTTPVNNYTPWQTSGAPHSSQPDPNRYTASSPWPGSAVVTTPAELPTDTVTASPAVQHFQSPTSMAFPRSHYPTPEPTGAPFFAPPPTQPHAHSQSSVPRTYSHDVANTAAARPPSRQLTPHSYSAPIVPTSTGTEPCSTTTTSMAVFPHPHAQAHRNTHMSSPYPPFDMRPLMNEIPSVHGQPQIPLPSNHNPYLQSSAITHTMATASTRALSRSWTQLQPQPQPTQTWNYSSTQTQHSTTSLVPAHAANLSVARQEPENVSLVYGLSSRFVEIAQPVPSPALDRTPGSDPNDEAVPALLRVQSSGVNPAVRKILCLDGGGVRGLASLYLVKHLMDRLNAKRGGRLEVWQEFDMIGGTSTGGLIALMLGRLRMPVEKCITAYQTLSRKIFAPVHSKVNIVGRAIQKFEADGKYESEPLERIVRDMCREYCLDESALLKDTSEDATKVFVCAVQGVNADAVVIRGYRSGSEEYDELYDICKIWEAARATSAASTFFEPIRIGNQRYVDGALKYNNPIEKADVESRELWPDEDRMIISIGTGVKQGPSAIAKNIVQLAKDTLVKIITECEEEDNKFRRRNKIMVDNNLLYRFNVVQGLGDVDLDESTEEAAEKIHGHTSTYLRSTDGARDFDRCADMLKESGQRRYIVGEELRIHRKLQELSTTYVEFCEDCHKGVPYRESMYHCVYCQTFSCEGCLDSHDRTHMRTLLRFENLRWMPKLPEVTVSASCSYCPKITKTRWECKSCKLALCLKCGSDQEQRKAFFDKHRESDPDGRAFLAIYPPYWSTKSTWVVDPCPCLELASTIHCDRCHAVVTPTHRAYDCRTCQIEFGNSQSLCTQCFDEESKEHISRHQFGSFTLVHEDQCSDKGDEALRNLFACESCPERFGQDKANLHPHLHLKLVLSPIFLEVIRRANYNKCHGKELRTRSVQGQFSSPTRAKCLFCGHVLHHEESGSLCIRQGCIQFFCSTCTLANLPLHRHPVQGMTMKEPPNDYTKQTMCTYCSKAYLLANVEGFWCFDCGVVNRHFMCLNCARALEKGDNKTAIAPGLPHQKILKQCKVKKGWFFYMKGSST